jgi:Peptidase family M23
MKRSLAVVVAAVLIHAPTAAGWSWPVDGPVVRPFVLGNDPYAAGQHRGIDIEGTPGTTVRAATAGSVTFVGTVPAGGRAVTVRTDGGLSVTYLELGETRAERGAEVAEGDAIGVIGAAAHVHLGVRVTADPHGYLDPLRFLPPRVSGAARADPVPGPPPSADVPPEPVAQAADGAEPPAAAAVVKARPEPEPEPVVIAPRAPEAAPSPAPAPTEVAAARVATAEAAPAAEVAPEAKAADTAEPKPEQMRPVDDRPQASPARRITAPEVARDAPTPTRVRPPSRVVSRALRPPRSHRQRRRIATPQVRVDRDEPKPVVTVPAPKGRAVGSPRVPAPAVGRNHSEPRVVPALLAACLLLGLAVGVAATLRRRRQGISVGPQSVGACSRARTRPPRLLHACARAGEVGWPATTTRSPSVIALHRPLPRPRRRLPVETLR